MANQIGTPEGVLSALSDPTNRQVVQNLRNGELSLGDLTGQLLVFPACGVAASSRFVALWLADCLPPRRTPGLCDCN